ncbi:hypothetical protein JTE90_017866 [Oedothorax gibbosus]|uniref:Gustatory receptor n=1 Tax=Oedothorax gibbosus TaxID=931172 RepID=A0AAV6V3Z9_9ARAC|nr:hypothetical protein JTE90_017866 [Oedothorax gibbosus]
MCKNILTHIFTDRCKHILTGPGKNRPAINVCKRESNHSTSERFHSIRPIIGRCGDESPHPLSEQPKHDSTRPIFRRLDYELPYKQIKRNISEFINEYQNVHELASLFELAISRQVFLINACHFVMVFKVVAKVLRFRKFYPSIFIENTSFEILHCVSFFCITYFAARVHEKDKLLRRAVESNAFRLWTSKDSRRCGRVLSQFIRSKKPIVFSAFDIYNFKKSLLLASAAVAVSYNLLVLQVKTAQEASQGSPSHEQWKT